MAQCGVRIIVLTDKNKAGDSTRSTGQDAAAWGRRARQSIKVSNLTIKFQTQQQSFKL